MTITFYTPPGWPDHEDMRQAAADRALARCGTLGARLQDIVEAASARFDAPIAAIAIVDHERQWFAASKGLDATESPRATSFCAHTILTPSDMMIVADATADERFAGNPVVIFDPFVRFYAGAPLVDGDGNAIGALCIVDRAARESPADYSDLRRLANEAARLLCG